MSATRDFRRRLWIASDFRWASHRPIACGLLLVALVLASPSGAQQTVFGGQAPEGSREIRLAAVTHEVRPGETAWGIARNYGVTPRDLLQLNRIEHPHLLSTGRQLRIPTLVPESRHRTVVLEPGDTLWRVAQRHGVDVASLQALNGITEPTRAVAGMRLRLPGSGAVPGTRLVEIDALMASADSAIRAAEFERARETVSRARSLVNELRFESGAGQASAVNARLARVEVADATLSVAYGQHTDAIAGLGRALQAEPDLEMDEQTTSPKLLRALQTARLLRDGPGAEVMVSAAPR